MLQFFHDAALTVMDSQLNPKRFVAPEDGLSGKTSVVYIADAYVSSITASAVSGAITLDLNATDGFLLAGTAYVTSGATNYTISYTGKTADTLTGVTGLTGDLNIGDTVKPWIVYKSVGNFTFTPVGSDLVLNIQLSLGTAPGQYNFPGSTVISSLSTYDSVLDPAIPIYISISSLSGAPEEFTNWEIVSNAIYPKDKNDSSAIDPTTEVGIPVTAWGYLFRRNNYQVTSLRLLPVTRELKANAPGFVIGTYRWRDDSTVNSVIVTPTKWDNDISAIGTENFVYGIGDGEDLVPIDIENVESSIYCRIMKGFYFAGPQQFFLPATPQIQFINGNQTGITLDPPPNIGYPIFVGTWSLDSNNFYQIETSYRYEAGGWVTGSHSSEYQYLLNKKTNLLVLNKALPQTTLYLGLLSGLSTDFFNIPTYPVDSVVSVFVNRGIGNIDLYSSNYSFDQGSGVLTITAPTTGLETSIIGANIGEPVYAVCNPAYAVVYDSGQSNTRLLDTVDLNPAFAGIGAGYLYLQHTRQEPTTLTLSADKPIIDVPATYASVIDLVAYGPIYFDGDYALLTAQAFGPLDNEPISGATLEIIPGDNFSGTINYLDPTINTVTAVTGADGKANFLYLPEKDYGLYIPKTAASGSLAGYATTTLANDTLVLPTPIAISQIYNTKEGWLVSTYNIINTDPILGMVGANTALGQLPFTTVGTAGTANYQTNGEKVQWSVGTVGITPIDARDIDNNSYTNPSFNGDVVKLIYNTSLITSGTVAAYFVTFVQIVSVQVRYVNSDVVSNIILLEMAMPNSLNDDPWLIINNATNGIINQYRLGWQQGVPGLFNE
jgi:hypothetical protein